MSNTVASSLKHAELLELMKAWDRMIIELDRRQREGQSLFLCGMPSILNIEDSIAIIIKEEIYKEGEKRGISRDTIRNSGIWTSGEYEKRRQFLRNQKYSVHQEILKLVASNSLLQPNDFTERERILLMREGAKKYYLGTNINWEDYKMKNPDAAKSAEKRINKLFPLPIKTVINEQGTEGWKWRLYEGELQYSWQGGSWERHKGSSAILAVVANPTIEVEE